MPGGVSVPLSSESGDSGTPVYGSNGSSSKQAGLTPSYAVSRSLRVTQRYVPRQKASKRPAWWSTTPKRALPHPTVSQARLSETLPMLPKSRFNHQEDGLYREMSVYKGSTTSITIELASNHRCCASVRYCILSHQSLLVIIIRQPLKQTS